MGGIGSGRGQREDPEPTALDYLLREADHLATAWTSLHEVLQREYACCIRTITRYPEGWVIGGFDKFETYRTIGHKPSVAAALAAFALECSTPLVRVPRPDNAALLRSKEQLREATSRAQRQAGPGASMANLVDLDL